MEEEVPSIYLGPPLNMAQYYMINIFDIWKYSKGPFSFLEERRHDLTF